MYSGSRRITWADIENN